MEVSEEACVAVYRMAQALQAGHSRYTGVKDGNLIFAG
jgi:hypothetical protein